MKPSFLGPKTNLSILYWISLAICLFECPHLVNAQRAEPFFQLGAGTSTIRGSSLLASLGVEWHGIRLFAQHWGSRQWGLSVRDQPPPCSIIQFGSTVFRYNDRFNMTSVQAGYRAKLFKVLRVGASAGLGRFVHWEKDLHRVVRTCDFWPFGGSIQYYAHYVTSSRKEGYRFTAQTSIGIAFDPKSEVQVIALFSPSHTLPVHDFWVTPQAGIALQVIGYF